MSPRACPKRASLQDLQCHRYLENTMTRGLPSGVTNQLCPKEKKNPKKRNPTLPTLTNKRK
ncbi:hypothetical protein BGAL_0187g00190 [Botrytis galanthina]|uniref:Uncharacterized protein n=1 Tax=Botrytis galanthina TaxID=278940 RepID=A0A4S8R5W3_9HELO|nr:hypothetical protein BGAL_0187g00190 [Botrytis galanthina]